MGIYSNVQFLSNKLFTVISWNTPELFRLEGHYESQTDSHAAVRERTISKEIHIRKFYDMHSTCTEDGIR
jgi:hypothetical protein